jgi:hypothetical protein
MVVWSCFAEASADGDDIGRRRVVKNPGANRDFVRPGGER